MAEYWHRPGVAERCRIRRRNRHVADYVDPNKREINNERSRAWCRNNSVHRREYGARKRASDPAYRIRILLRNRLAKAIKRRQKAGSAVKDLGCSIPEFMAYIETQFQDGMTWANWGPNTWHLDHIRPLSSFDLSDAGQLRVACHFSNMQPLWAKENMAKSNKQMKTHVA